MVGAGKTVAARLRAVAALTRFELSRSLRIARVRVVGVALPGLVWIGIVLAGRGSAGLEHEFFRLGTLLALALGVGFRVGQDRELGFDGFIIANLAPAGTYLAAKILSAALFVGLLSGYGLLVGTALSGGDVWFAVWHAFRLALLGWLLSPLAFAVELVMATRVPMVLVLMTVVVALLMAAAAGVDVGAVYLVLGLGSTPGDLPGLRRLAWRTLTAVPSAYALLMPVAVRRLPAPATPVCLERPGELPRPLRPRSPRTFRTDRAKVRRRRSGRSPLRCLADRSNAPTLR